MKTFKDAAGHEWNIRLTLGLARNVMDKLGINLLHPEEQGTSGTTLLEALTDPFKVAEIVEILLSREFEKRSVSSEDVIMGDWDGSTIEAAYQSLLGELVLFFESQGQRARAKMIAKIDETTRLAMAKTSERLDALDVPKMIDEALIDGAKFTKPLDD